MNSKDKTNQATSSRKTTKSLDRSQSSTTKHVATSIATNTSNNKNKSTSNSCGGSRYSSTKPSSDENKKKNNNTKQKPNNTNQRSTTSTSSTSSRSNYKTNVDVKTQSSLKKQTNNEKLLVDLEKDDTYSSEMATTNQTNFNGPKDDILIEIETNVDGDESEEASLLTDNTSSTTTTNNNNNSSQKKITKEQEQLPDGWEQHRDKIGPYFWHVSSGVIQRSRPSLSLNPSKDSILICHDDEEINVNTNSSNYSRKSSNDYSVDDGEDEYYDISGAALTVDDTTTAADDITIMNDVVDESTNSFVVYPLGCCEFDETQLVSTTSTKVIQKCILKLSNRPVNDDEVVCWGLTQSQPVLLRLFDDYIQFTDIRSKTLLRSQPIQTIKTWAVDDDNNFAFVIEDRPEQLSYLDQTTSNQQKQTTDQDYLDYELLNEPTLICYVFHSMDDDDMSCKVASKLNEQINRYKEQLSNRISRSTRVQQMRIEQKPLPANIFDKEATDVEEDFNDNANDEDDDELEANNEMTINVKYIGKTPVPKPVGIEVLNVAIDKCLAEASKAQINRSIAMQQEQQQLKTDNKNNQSTSQNQQQQQQQLEEPLIEAKLHVSPSSVIVENTCTGEIIVECRIRFLTFMGISKRDIRWCGFIMQNSTNKSFVAHCFECHPTAGHVCEAIQLSCSRMYEKVIKNSSLRHNNESEEPEAISIIPSKSKIRNTLAKTLLRIRLNPLVSNLH